VNWLEELLQQLWFPTFESDDEGDQQDRREAEREERRLERERRDMEREREKQMLEQLQRHWYERDY
jgi:hypothetical protein